MYQQIKISGIYSFMLIAAYIAVSILNGRIELYYGCFGKSYLLSIIAVVMLFFAFSNVLKIPGNNILKAYSIGTLLILGTHSLVFPVLVGLLDDYLAHNVSVLVCTIFYFVIIYPIIVFTNKNFPILLGKLSKK